MREVFELYGIGNGTRVDLDLIEPLEYLIEADSSTPLRQQTEATKSIFTWIFLNKIIVDFNSQFKPKFKISQLRDQTEKAQLTILLIDRVV